MRYKTKEVEQYQPKYRVFDKSERKFCAEFDELYDAVVYCGANAVYYRWDVPKISYTLKTESEYEAGNWKFVHFGKEMRRVYERESYPAAKFVILTDLGDVVTKEQVEEARRANYVYKHSRWQNPSWEEQQFNRDSRLVYTKGSPKKIKKAYRKVYCGEGRWGHDFRNEVWVYYRHPKTHGEIKQACAHADEYGEQIVRAKRRYNNVPDAWDEYCSDVWGTQKSWKHNSKRRKQWVPK